MRRHSECWSLRRSAGILPQSDLRVGITGRDFAATHFSAESVDKEHRRIVVSAILLFDLVTW